MNGASVAFENVATQAGSMRFRFSFSRAAGSVTPVLGASGSGKSTLLNLLAGFLAPSSGEVLIDGKPASGLPPGARGISMVFQDNNLFSHLSIADNVGLGLDPALKLDADQKKQVENALDRVGLKGFGARLPGSLSGGERQRAALARAFARQSPILALDEPFSGLGPGLAAGMQDLMLDLHGEVGMTVFLITHDPAEALKAGGAALFLDQGHKAADESVETLFERNDLEALSQWLGR